MSDWFFVPPSMAMLCCCHTSLTLTLKVGLPGPRKNHNTGFSSALKTGKVLEFGGEELASGGG